MEVVSIQLQSFSTPSTGPSCLQQVQKFTTVHSFQLSSSKILDTPGSQSLKAARSHGLTTLGLAVAKSRCIEGLKIFSSVQGLKVPGYQGVKVSGSQGLMSQAIRFKFKGLMMSFSRTQGFKISGYPRLQGVNVSGSGLKVLVSADIVATF